MKRLMPDVLFTLLGHKSAVLQFVVDHDGDFTDGDHTFVVSRTEDRILLRRFLSVAEEYRKLHARFHVTHDLLLATSVDGAPADDRGVYFGAFVGGVSVALRPYRKCVYDVEKDLPAHGVNAALMAETLRRVETHKPFMVTVNDIMERIEFSRLRGGQILDLVYEAILVKCMDEARVLSIVFKQCLQVLKTQLKTFFARGEIFDPYKEFFIEAQFHKSTNKFKRFSILHDLMPGFVPVSTASKITRIGEVVKSLLHSHDQSVLINYKDISTELYGLKKDQLFSDLLNLENVTFFTKQEFVGVIDQFHDVVDEYMFKACSRKNSIKNHMKLVREFYLLGNGEFFSHFLNKISIFSMKSEHSLRAIRLAFIYTAHDVKLHKSTYKIFGFSSLENNVSDEITWSKIKVTIETTWPLQFIFTNHVQKNYSKLFSFLSRIKRVQTNLHKIWIEKETKSYKINGYNTQLNDQLKTKLTFLIDTLYSYFQLDVIEVEYFMFLEKLSEANDFQTIKYLHDLFQTNIMRDSFLFIEEVHTIFNLILDMCENYCRSITDITAALTPQFYIQSQTELSLLFTKKPNKLITVLNIIRKIHVTSKPKRLLVRLNYNNWFSKIMSADS